MASYFPEAANLNGSNADICSDVAGPWISGSGNLFELSDHRSRTFIISPSLVLVTGRHLGFERDYNYHTAFRAYYVIVHEVYHCAGKSGNYSEALAQFLTFTVYWIDSVERTLHNNSSIESILFSATLV